MIEDNRCKDCNDEIDKRSTWCKKCAYKKKNRSKETLKKISIANSNEGNSMWNGGVRYHGTYKYVKSPNHPNCDGRGYIPEHHLIIEKKLGRYIDIKKEVVHHIDGDKTNNSIKNLKVMLINKHNQHHAFQRWKDKKQPIKYCLDCKKALGRTRPIRCRECYYKFIEIKPKFCVHCGIGVSIRNKSGNCISCGQRKIYK